MQDGVRTAPSPILWFFGEKLARASAEAEPELDRPARPGLRFDTARLPALGPTVTGKIFSGQIHKGDKIHCGTAEDGAKTRSDLEILECVLGEPGEAQAEHGQAMVSSGRFGALLLPHLLWPSKVC